MTLRKSSLLVGRDRIHYWDDKDLPFRAECYKGDKMWVAKTESSMRIDSTYQGAVDWVMDQYRLTKAGLNSWDGPAAILASADNLEWERLTTDERTRYINAARKNAREQGGI